jgi:hypothetical protein
VSSSSRVEMSKKNEESFFLDISTFVKEDTTLPQNIGIQLPRDSVSCTRRT